MAVLNNLWIRGGKQKLGGVVLYQLNGQTLARELAPSISNPRTTSQMTQRVRLANLVAFYKANKSWMKHSFEDKSERSSDYNAFVSANIGTNLVALTKSEAAGGAAVVGPYQITRGSLLSIEHTLSGSTIKTNINLGNYQITATTTIGALSAAILANNLTLSEGMQLSLIVNTQQAGNASQQPYIVCRAYELILYTSSTSLLTDFFPESVTSVAAGTNNYALGLNTTTYAEGGAAFILSQTAGGVTRVSSQRIQMFGSQSVYNAHISASALAAAIASYGESTDVFLDTANANALVNVLATQTILSVTYDGQTYVAGDEFDGVLEADTQWSFQMSQPIPEGATLSATATSNGLGDLEMMGPTANGSVVSGVSDGDTDLTTNGQPVEFNLFINGEKFTIKLVYNNGQHLGD